jgi:hypothetical protein
VTTLGPVPRYWIVVQALTLICIVAAIVIAITKLA